jgi:RNA-directed DNA polymerase
MNVSEPEITSVTDLTDRELSNRWKSVDWKRVEKFVNNLQSRIASAAKNNDWKKVSKLSRLLTRSFYARLLAVRKVSGNKGSKTPGVDGKLWLSMSDKMRAALLLKSK